MIVDTSAIVAVILRAPGFQAPLDKLVAASVLGSGTPTLAETGMVLRWRLGADARGLLGRFLQEFAVVSVPFGDAHWRTAVDAYGRYGKGRHRAALNFGDCLTYATAKLAGRPLICVGDDFARTDLELA